MNLYVVQGWSRGDADWTDITPPLPYGRADAIYYRTLSSDWPSRLVFRRWR